MADVGVFFDRIDRHGHEYLPPKVNGTIRFDLSRGEQTDHWLMAIKKGNVFISRDKQDADVVVRTSEAFFESIMVGEADMLAAILRNEVTVEGSLALLLNFRRVLPSAPGASDPRQRGASSGGQRQ